MYIFKISGIIFKTMEIIFKINEHIFEINHIVIFFYDNTCHPILYIKHQCIYKITILCTIKLIG